MANLKLSSFVLLSSLLLCSSTDVNKIEKEIAQIYKEEKGANECHPSDEKTGQLDKNTMCSDSEIDPKLEKRKLTLCHCSKDKDCHAEMPDMKTAKEGGSGPVGQYVYYCKWKFHPKRPYNMGLFMPDPKKDDKEVVEAAGKTEVVEESKDKKTAVLT